jgi:predicted transcriptional regulator
MYNVEEVIEPFWAEYSSEASGRDPLAIQNSSVVIYSKMIVGITNVTNRIRYNGFFCWIFDKIVKSIDKRNSLSEQIRYSRRAELLLAFIMVKKFQGVTGVSGSNYATNNMKSKIRLNEGSDWEYKTEVGSGLYWKFKAGIFGQYYSGVMRELNLINHPHGELNIYSLTKEGKALALAFEQSIMISNSGFNEPELFWKCVHDGNVNEADLGKLQSFALHLIPKECDELKIYEKLMLAPDDKKVIPTYNRKNTIKLVLQYLQTQTDGVENPTASFLRDNYSKQGSKSTLGLDSATAWYLFEMNELLHVAYEHFHVCFLYSIQTYPTILDKAVDQLLKQTIKAFMDDKIDAKTFTTEELAQLLNTQKLNTYDYYDDMLAYFKVGEYGKTLQNAIKTIFNTFLDSKTHLQLLKDFAVLPENNFNRPGFAGEIINDLVQSKLNMTIVEYTRSILLSAINLHMFSSYRKSMIGQGLVHNYMIEGPTVWQLRRTLPNRTTPRMQNAIQYISDIGWVEKIDNKYCITETGKQILTSL